MKKPLLREDMILPLSMTQMLETGLNPEIGAEKEHILTPLIL